VLVKAAPKESELDAEKLFLSTAKTSLCWLNGLKQLASTLKPFLIKHGRVSIYSHRPSLY
jgi:hypothetical protein